LLAVSLPTRPCVSLSGPGGEQDGVRSADGGVLPTSSAQRPSITIGLPDASVTGPMKWPVCGFQRADPSVAEVAN